MFYISTLCQFIFKWDFNSSLKMTSNESNINMAFNGNQINKTFNNNQIETED